MNLVKATPSEARPPAVDPLPRSASEPSVVGRGGLEAVPPIMSFRHLVEIGAAPTVDAARKLSGRWPASVRVSGVGRKVLFKRDEVFRLLGLIGEGKSAKID